MDMMGKPRKAFYSYAQAAAYLGKDSRSIRKYEHILFIIDKSLPNKHTRLRHCKVCNQPFKSSENRNGYCPTCSQKGEGRKSQAKSLSQTT